MFSAFRADRPEASPSDLFFATATAASFRKGAWTQADLKARQNAGPVYLYELDWQTPVEGGKWHSPHSLDLALVFDNVAKSASMVGSGPEPRRIAERMSSAWLAFARTGDPSTKELPWPAWRPNSRATMVFDRSLWDGDAYKPRIICGGSTEKRRAVQSVFRKATKSFFS